MKTSQPKYSEDLETLLALISSLSMTSFSMRTASNLSKDLSIDTDVLITVLDKYKSLFRRSRRQSDKGNYYYGLQLRYALQFGEEETDEGIKKVKPPLETDHVTALLNFVSNKAKSEKDRSSSLTVAWVAAIALIAVTFIELLKK